MAERRRVYRASVQLLSLSNQTASPAQSIVWGIGGERRLFFLTLKYLTMTQEKQYTGTYKVVKLFRKSNRRQVLRRGLTIDEAKRVVNSYPDSNRSMVVFTKQFWADKYFI